MKVLIIDQGKVGLHLALLASWYGHDVMMFEPRGRDGKPSVIGAGIVATTDDWHPYVQWADLVICTDNNKYAWELEPLHKRGVPIIGANKDAASLELDRGLGQRVLKQHGVQVSEGQTFTSYGKAIQFVKQNSDQTFVSKPWGGADDKAMSYVPKSPADLVFMLQDWQAAGRHGEFLLQEKIGGHEMAVGGWFGPGGWCDWLNENWEEKRYMNGGLGDNTGEMGTIMRYVKRSKLFSEVLEPVTDYLHQVRYVGYVDMNCIVDDSGQPWPLEFTMRFGWPHYNIALSLHQGDPVEFLYNLYHGQDTLLVSEDIAAGIVMQRPTRSIHPAPIYGLTESVLDKVCLQEVQLAMAPMMAGEKVVQERTLCTAGDYVLVTTGTGPTVRKASKSATEVAWKIDWPGARAFRTDIGERMSKDLPALQKYGYAKKMEF